MLRNHAHLQRRDRHCLVVWALVAIGSGVPAATAIDPTEGQPDPDVTQGLNQLKEVMQGVNWEKESQFAVQALDNLWKRNKWNDESDSFAHDLACEVAAIPPWNFIKRLETVNTRLQKRYAISDQQSLRLKGMMFREVGGLFLRNMDILLNHVQEVMQTRAEGKPFSSEQVARWTKEGEPLMGEMRQIGERFRSTLRTMLVPGKLEVLDRDMQSFEKRREYVDRMAERWKKGEWTPADWGLEDDPLHRNQAATLDHEATNPQPRGKRALRPPASTRIPKCVAEDPATWYACVLESKRRFEFDLGQMTTADSIHAELFERANAYRKTRAEALLKVPPGQRAKHESYEPIRNFFAELNMRIEAIATTSQRKSAKP